MWKQLLLILASDNRGMQSNAELSVKDTLYSASMYWWMLSNIVSSLIIISFLKEIGNYSWKELLYVVHSTAIHSLISWQKGFDKYVCTCYFQECVGLHILILFCWGGLGWWSSIKSAIINFWLLRDSRHTTQYVCNNFNIMAFKDWCTFL